MRKLPFRMFKTKRGKRRFREVVTSYYLSKKDANDVAVQLRKKGNLARVVKKSGGYSIYTRGRY